MIYSEFKDTNLSLLGFGAMRLPLLDEKTGTAKIQKRDGSYGKNEINGTGKI